MILDGMGFSVIEDTVPLALRGIQVTKAVYNLTHFTLLAQMLGIAIHVVENANALKDLLEHHVREVFALVTVLGTGLASHFQISSLKT